MKRETVEEFLKRGGVIQKCPEVPRIRHFAWDDDVRFWTRLRGGATSLTGEPLHTFPLRTAGDQKT